MITWQQSAKNENLFRCMWDNKVLIGTVLKSAAPLIPDNKYVYGYWANDGRMFSLYADAQAYVVAKATKPKLD